MIYFVPNGDIISNFLALVDTYKSKGLRKALVRVVKSKGIQDERILAAIGKIPRHFFLDSTFLEKAYEDTAFPIAEGQTISQPYTVAFQTELLNLKKGDKVLEIGTGSGYQSCVLLELGAVVYTMEYNVPLCQKAKSFLPQLGYVPKMICGDGSQGLPRYAPYDKILVTAGAPVVPKALKEQLKVGGVLVIPVGDAKTQTMLRITRVSEKDFEEESFHDFKFVPLLGASGWRK